MRWGSNPRRLSHQILSLARLTAPEPMLICSRSESNRRPMAHKTIALTTELQELREVGFEPTKAMPPDLKSGPFDRSGTHAYL